MDGQKPKIIIDDELRLMVQPLLKDAYLRLEADILKKGCREPLKLWRGILVDGMNRLSICTRRNIAYRTEELEFSDRNEVIAYIAAIQLLRTDIPEEVRRYLIGKRFEAEKAIAINRKLADWNLYARNADLNGLPYRLFNPSQLPKQYHSLRNPTALRLAQEYCVSADTIDKYAKYARAVDAVFRKDPMLIKMLLSGKYKIPQSAIITLAKRSAQDIQRYREKITTEMNMRDGMRPRVLLRNSQHKFVSPAHNDGAALKIGVKDVPKPNPDAEINRLSLTLPSWTDSIIRVHKGTDFETVSVDSRHKLENALSTHQEAVTLMLTDVRKEDESDND